MERKLLFISDTDVATDLRRGHNQDSIKQNLTDPEPSGITKFQNHIEHHKTGLRIGLELFVFALIIVVPLSVHANIFDIFSNEIVAIKEDPEAAAASDIELLAAKQNPDPSENKGGADLIIEENALVSSGPVGRDAIAKSASSGEIRVYTVREGDSLSQIAEMFGVTANTIMWANDISKSTGIAPGQTLVILPIAGVRHVVKSGDTIDSIAKKYEGDSEEILSYNQLATASDIVVGDTLIIPGGELHAAVTVESKSNGKSGSKTGGGSGGAGFTHPAPGSVKTQGIHGYNAVDLAGSTGSTIRAAAAGEVIVAKSGGWNGGYGNYIVVKHNNGTQTLYAHLSSLSVGVGNYVEQGETIGGMGNTGKSTGTHLHFEVRGGRNPF